MPETAIAYFTRLIGPGPAAERYRAAVDQIRAAEALGYRDAWVAQHHLDGDEGGLPSPFVLLAAAAAVTTRIRLGTGVVTLPLEQPLRVAEDAAVLDALSGGRVELGLGSGSTPRAFEALGRVHADRAADFEAGLHVLHGAFAGDLGIYPAAQGLTGRLWQATFSPAGAARAGRAGDGLMLSRTQPRFGLPDDAPLSAVQHPVIDAYLAALPGHVQPRVLLSRSVIVTDEPDEAYALFARDVLRIGDGPDARAAAAAALAADDVIVGDAAAVADALARDGVHRRATVVAFQHFPVPLAHALAVASIERIAREVAPALGLAVA